MMKQREMSQKMLQGVAEHILAINDFQIRFLQKFQNFQPQNPILDPKITFSVIFGSFFEPVFRRPKSRRQLKMSKT